MKVLQHVTLNTSAVHIARNKKWVSDREIKKKKKKSRVWFSIIKLFYLSFSRQHSSSSHHLHPFICTQEAPKRKRGNTKWKEKNNKGDESATGMSSRSCCVNQSEQSEARSSLPVLLQRASLTWSPVSSVLTAMQGSALLHFVSSILWGRHHCGLEAPISEKRVINVLHGCEQKVAVGL